MAGRVYPLIVPSQYKDSIPDIGGGVGTPRMVYDPETGGWLLFFTGWRNANSREIYYAEVEKDMTLGRIRKILPSPPTRDAVNVIYDPWRDGFIVLTTEGGPLQIRCFDRGLKELGSRRLLDGMQDSGAGILSLMGNYSEENPNAAIFYPKGDRVLWRLVKRVDDLNALELGEEMVFSNWEDSNDVIDAFRVNDRFGVLVEYFADRQNWRSRIAMCGAFLSPNVRGLSASLPVPFNDGHSNFGHPSFTTGPDGKPKVLFSFFMSHAPPFPVLDYSRQWRHEIWVWEPSFNIFDVKTYGRMYDRLVFDDKAVKNPPFYDLLGARRVFFGVSCPSRKTLTIRVQQAVSLKAHLEGSFVEESFRVVKHAWRTLDNPLGTLRINAGKGSTVWLVAEY
ncbi:MAG: hypothetical protein QXU11_00185 [Thermoproteota archaeon]|nr:hypothetical protein [Candidatus Brockarchaeota archaeon]